MKKCIKSIVIAVLTGCLVLSATACSSKEVSSGEKDVKIESSENVEETTQEEEEELTEEEKVLIIKCNDKTCNLSKSTLKDLVLLLKEAKIPCNVDLGERLEPYGSDDYKDDYIDIEYYNKSDKEILAKDANIEYFDINFFDDEDIFEKFNSLGFVNGEEHFDDYENIKKNVKSKLNGKYNPGREYEFIIDDMRITYINIVDDDYNNKADGYTFSIDRIVE